MKKFAFLGLTVGFATMMAGAAVAAAPADSTLPPLPGQVSAVATPMPGIITVSEIGSIFNHGHVDIPIAYGPSSSFQDVQQVAYIAAATKDKDGNVVVTPGTFSAGVLATYEALPAPNGRVAIRFMFSDTKLLPFGKVSAYGETVDVPQSEETHYSGVAVVAYGKPVSLAVPLPGNATATLRFTVNQHSA